MEQDFKEQEIKNKEEKEPKTIVIIVNRQPVSFGDHKATGIHIKEAAKNQGVKIDLDFNLFEVKGTELKQILDNDEVALHKNQEFRAVTPDDSSMKVI